jgi:hypothetical protein
MYMAMKKARRGGEHHEDHQPLEIDPVADMRAPRVTSAGGDEHCRPLQWR